MTLKYNVYVITAYLLRFYFEYTIIMFLFTFSTFVQYLTFVLKNFNDKLKVVLSATNNRYELEGLETAIEFYETVLELINHFYNIFKLQVSASISFIIVKMVLTVRT